MNEARPVSSNQHGPHEDTVAVVERHLNTVFKKPFQEHNLRAFEEINAQVEDWKGPVILDSCCGVGESTAKLAVIWGALKNLR